MLNANWIQPSYKFSKVCPLFRKDFSVERQVSSVTLYITARGVYEATLNGQRVGNFIMAPGWTSYHNRMQVQSYDVTDLLKKNNSLILHLAEGWFWRLKKSQPKAIIAELRISYADGTTESIEVTHTYNDQQIAWFKAGAALNIKR